MPAVTMYSGNNPPNLTTLLGGLPNYGYTQSNPALLQQAYKSGAVTGNNIVGKKPYTIDSSGRKIFTNAQDAMKDLGTWRSGSLGGSSYRIRQVSGGATTGNALRSGSSDNIANQVMQSYTQAESEAKKANEQRYQDILAGYGDLYNNVGSQYSDLLNKVTGKYSDRYGTAMDILQGMGAQEKSDIVSAYEDMAGKQQQDLVARGFSGTTVLPTMQRGVERQKTEELGRLDERIRAQKLDVHSNLSGDEIQALQSLGTGKIGALADIYGGKLGVMERRTDAYPDLGQYLQLMQGLGQAGEVTGTGGGSSSGGYLPASTRKGQNSGITIGRKKENGQPVAYGMRRPGTTYRPNGTGFTGGYSQLTRR